MRIKNIFIDSSKYGLDIFQTKSLIHVNIKNSAKIIKSTTTQIPLKRRTKNRQSYHHIDSHRGERGRDVKSEKLSQKNAITQKRGPTLNFLTTLITPLKIILPKPQGPPEFPTSAHL